MNARRITATAGLVIFFLLAGTTAGYAMWSSSASTSGRVESGAVAVTQSGAAALAATYASAPLADTAPITITNTGTIIAPHTLQISAPTSAVAQGVLVNTWPVSALAQCAPATVTPTTATSTNLTNVPVLTGTLAPSAVAYYCIRTSITAAQQTSLAAQSVTISSVVTSALGTWKSTPAADTAVQTVSDTAAPSVPVPSARTLRTSTTLTWPASTDNVATSSYDVYRNGVIVGTVSTPSFTNTGLTAGTAYSYTVQAKDAAGNTSAASAALSVKTVNPPVNTRLVLTNSATGRCLDGEGVGTTSGTSLIDWGCHGAANQSWDLASASTDYYLISALYTSTKKVAALVWDYDSTGKYVGLYTPTAQTRQEWQIVAVSPDVFQFVNRANNLCMQMGSVTTDGIKTTLANCANIPQQTFKISLR